MAATLFRGPIFADYFQFYLRDEGHPVLPDDCSEATIAGRIAAGPCAVVVHAARNMSVPVTVTWSDARPAPDVDGFQHVVEAGFACPSGRLLVAGLTDDEETAPRVEVTAGQLGVRVSFCVLDTLDDSGLEGDDRYYVEL